MRAIMLTVISAVFATPVVIPAVAGQIVSDWPDVIVCKEQETINAITTTYQIPLYLSKSGLVEGQGAYVANYASIHWHDATGGVNDQYLMSFAGSTADQASALAVPSGTLDCPPGITVGKLRAQGQTRNFRR
jgi:hypothetical protein